MVGPAASAKTATPVGKEALSSPVIKPSAIVNVSGVPPKKPVILNSEAVEFMATSIAKELDLVIDTISEDASFCADDPSTFQVNLSQFALVTLLSTNKSRSWPLSVRVLVVAV